MKVTKEHIKIITEFVKNFNQKHPSSEKQNVLHKAARFLRGKKSDNELDTKDIILRLSLRNVYEVNAVLNWMKSTPESSNTTEVPPAHLAKEIQEQLSSSTTRIRDDLKKATSMDEIKNAILPVERRLAEIKRNIEKEPTLACATVSGSNMLNAYTQAKIQPEPNVLQNAREASLQEINVLLALWKGEALSFKQKQLSNDSLLMTQILQKMQDLPLDAEGERRPFQAAEVMGSSMQKYGRQFMRTGAFLEKSLLRPPLQSIPEETLEDVTAELLSCQEECQSVC